MQVMDTREATCLTEMIFPEHANHYGTLFGGTALSLMGKAAFVAASRRAGGPVVMAASQRVDFLRPIRVGQIATFTAQVTRVGRSSMTVEVEAQAEDLGGPLGPLALRGSFEMVAVNGEGRPVPLPHLSPLSASEEAAP